ncbi:MAG: hypothetical protein QME66_12825 [Candidatus Eisenbacteria bacterium]|nr:hypothetical protein [Candidatus Eisenbacteria bacterium]
MRPKRYIVWSKNELDLRDPFQKKWYIKQVLTHGRAEDVARLDWQEIRAMLPELGLPTHIRRLWEGYFAAQG